MKYLLSLILSFNLHITATQANEICVKEAQKSPLYKALKSCEENKLKSTIKNFSNIVKPIDLSGTCTQCYFELSANKQLAALCEDPNGFVCKQKGKIIDSECKYNVLEPTDMMGVPSFAKTICDARDLNKTAEEKSTFIKAQIYSKDRIGKMKKLYEETKASYLAMINESTRLSAANKKILMNKIAKTRLALDPSDLSGSAHS
ncbi:MAG: hypothetical protein K2Q18_12415, partial [Bdellovibrionales bacterium]|nr:hypothetical protein [Bdellovibrionales bacterium]